MHFLKKYLNNNILKERLKCNISESTVNTVFVAEAFGLISSSLTTYSTKYLFFSFFYDIFFVTSLYMEDWIWCGTITHTHTLR